MPAPDVTLPNTNSSLVNAVTSSAPQLPAPVLNESGSPDNDSTPSYTPGNRLAAVLGAVSKVASTAFAGIPAGNRPDFAGGLGQGARAEQQAQATDQAIKFRSFDDQVRAANLHNQDLQKQAATDQQNAAQRAAEDFQNEELGKQGGDMQTHPNSGPAVIQTFQGQTAGNGSAFIEAGTHISADGKNINVPAPTPQTLAAQITNNNALAGVLPGVTRIATFDPATAKSPSDVVAARAAVGRQLDVTQHLLQGYDVNGNPLSHAQLNDLIPAYQAQIDSLTKNGGASDYQIGTLKNTLAILQANEQNHSDAEDAVNAKVDARKAAQAGAVANAQLPSKIAGQDNAAADKNQGAAPTPDPFGVASTLPAKEADSRYNSFSKSYVQPLTKTDQTASQFQSILNDVNSGKDLTGAQSVVSLFDAIGISATPMKGQGFRLNKDVMQEHVQARGVDQSVAQKLGQLKSGEIITPQQIKDYAQIATQARESQYSSAIDEARRQGLPVDFLPKGNGATLDPSTARMYIRAAGGPNNAVKAETAAQQAGWRLQ